jgi:hypothetical protein
MGSLVGKSRRFLFYLENGKVSYSFSHLEFGAERRKQMEHYIKAAILENEFEAQLVDSILTERDIPHCLTSYHDTAYNGLYQTQLGWGYLTAPETYQDEIEEILTDLRTKACEKNDTE